jgi:Tol biopolymer transport system component/tRNA A-37 threonylcarbamoyl transferase component Bud32
VSVDSLTAALADRYTIERELGQGGMATVYLADDMKHGRKVAIKVLRPELAAVIGAERFLREIKTIAALQHPHILGLIDSGEVTGTAYYVMPFVEGESLRDRLNREKQLPIGDAVRLATEVASALDYAHRHGVIHRDIKPENILLHDGSALVADFGIALAVSSAGAGSRMTETGMSLGTPHYMSPEQAMGEREITARSDVYALGAMTYEMLIGDPPFTGSTAQAIIAKVMTSEPVDLTSQRKSVPPAVDDAVLTALQKLPADRFATAADFAAALNSSATPRARVRRSTWLADPRSWAAIAIVAVSLAATAFLLLHGRAAAGDMGNIAFAQNSFRSEAIFNARWAPDGKTIVYSASSRGPTPHLYVIRPDYPEPQPLGPDSTHLLAISRNGELALLTHAVHLHHRLFVGTLARMPLGGGTPRDVLTNVQEADWSPDGSELAITRTVGDHGQLEYPVGKVLYQGTSGGYLSDPRVSPSGDRVTVVEHAFVGDDRGWIVVVNRAGKASRVSTEFSGVEGLGWARDGRALLFSASPNGFAMQVQRADLSGQSRLALASAGSLVMQDIGPDGRLLVTSDDLSHGLVARAPGQTADRDISWMDGSLQPVLSADGSRVAFTDVSQTGGVNYAVMLRKTDGSPAVRLGEGGALSISPDGQWVVGLVSTPPQVWMYPTGAGTPRRLNWTGLKTVSSVAFFPDGKSLFVCGSPDGKSSRCYRSPLDASNLQPMTPDGISGGVPRPDGSGVLVQQGHNYVIYPAAGGPPTPVNGIGTDSVIRWSPDGAALWTEASTPTGLRVDRVDVATGRRSVLLSIDAPPTVFTFARIAVADDPKSYVYETRRWLSLLFTVSGIR